MMISLGGRYIADLCSVVSVLRWQYAKDMLAAARLVSLCERSAVSMESGQPY